MEWHLCNICWHPLDEDEMTPLPNGFRACDRCWKALLERAVEKYENQNRDEIE